MKAEEERPLAIKLIIIYILLSIVYVIISILVGYGGFIGLGAIIMLFALYHGLWKMQKAWMEVIIFLLAVTTGIQIIFLYAYGIFIDTFIMVILNIASILWISKNRKLFKEPKKKEVAPKPATKDEGIKLVLLIVGWILIPILIGMIGWEYIGYALLSIPIWAVFVWFILPRIIKLTISKRR